MSFKFATAKTPDYFWVTWLTKLLAGENKCEWAIWFKVHNKFTKLDNGFELDRWTAEHNDLVLFRMQQLSKEGYEVFVEDQNSFQARGKSGIIVAGKPDIIAIRGEEAIFEDCKTGRKRDSDHYQVLIYMLLAHLPQIPNGARKTARIVYKDSILNANLAFLPQLGDRLRDLVLRLSDAQAPEKHPLQSECRFCDISDFYCEDRINDPGNTVYLTDEF